jgi:predicted RNA methylase
MRKKPRGALADGCRLGLLPAAAQAISAGMSSYADLAVHRWMLRDVVRNEAFQRALREVVKPGQAVLDLGAGTGLLSIFAADAGARRVYALERTAIAAVARRMIERNGHADVIEVHEMDVEDARLPEQVDVIVSEWMGGFGVDENILPSLVIARDRWLKPGGVIVPGRVTAVLAPVAVPEFDEELAYWRSKPHGVDMDIVASMTAQETFHTQVPLTRDSLLAEPQAMWSHDPYTCSLEEADQPFIAKLRFVATRAGRLTGFAAWFTAEMSAGGELLSNAVGLPDTHWGRTLFPLDAPLEVAEATAFDVELRCEPSMPGSCEMAWTLTLPGRPPEVHDTRRHRTRDH